MDPQMEEFYANERLKAAENLVEQQRIANLIAFSAASGLTFEESELMRLNQEMAKALGITLKPKYRREEEEA